MTGGVMSNETWRKRFYDLWEIKGNELDWHMDTNCQLSIETFISAEIEAAEKRGYEKAKEEWQEKRQCYTCKRLDRLLAHDKVIEVLKYAQQDLLNFRKLVFEMWALGDKLPKECRDLTMDLHNANCGPLDRHIKNILKEYEEEGK